MQSRTFKMLFFLFGFCHAVIASELIPPKAVGNLALEVDAYSFWGDAGPYEEIAIRFPAAHLTFLPQGDSLKVGQYIPHLHVFDSQDQLIKKIEGTRSYALPAGADIDGHFVTDVTQFQLAPGVYRAIVSVETVDHAHVGRATFSMTVPKHQVGHLFLSDLFFFHEKHVQNADGELDPFQKAHSILLPAPTRTFQANGMLGFYVTLSEIGQLAHQVRFQILDVFDQPVFLHVRNFPTYRERAQFVEEIPLRGLLPGAYTLRVVAHAGEQTATSQRRFHIVGSPPQISEAFTASRQDGIQKALERYSGAEVAQKFQNLSQYERAQFAYNHWLVRQPYFARAYVGPITGLSSYEMSLSLLKALGHEGTLKKRVDKTFGERLASPDTLAIREAREMLQPFLKANDAYATIANAFLALEEGALAEGDDYAQQAIKKAPHLSEAFQVLGFAKIGRKDWKGAREYFQYAQALSPNWPDAQVSGVMVDFLSGQVSGETVLGRLEDVVAQDMTHPWLPYLLGRIYERNGQLAQSEKAYRQQIIAHPLHGRARFDRGRILFKQGRIDSATAIWRGLMEDRPRFRDICIYPLLDAYLNTGETGKAQALIAEELRTLDDEARARVEDIAWVASPSEWATYEALPEEERPRFVRAFWQKRDPTPATPGNERLVAHYRRVLYAMRTFSQNGKTWDRRGDVYIRYGEPAHISKRGDVRFETDRDVVAVKERLLRMLSPEAKQEILARASRLRTSTRDVEIESEGAEAVEVSDFESIDFEMNPNRSFFASGSDDVNTYVRGKELFGRDRVGMSDRTIRGLPLYPVNGSAPWEYWIYPDVAGGIEVVFTALTPKGSYDFPDVSQGRKLARFNQRLWEDHRPEVVLSRAVKTQPDRYVRPGDGIDFHYASADFRGEKEGSRFEVYLGVPILDLVASEDQSGEFERGIALFDSSWTPIYRQIKPISFQAQEKDVEEGSIAVDELALHMLPGRYYLGVQVRHPTSNRQGSYTQEIVVEDYNKPTLLLSDIELAGEVQADSTNKKKGGFRVVPLPSRSYKLGQPIVVYYEVYNLHINDFGQSQYRVDYRITPRKGKLSGIQVLQALGRLLGIEEKSVVTISYEHTGTLADEHNYIQIDPGDSKPGRYEVSVTITDQNSGETAEKSVVFLIAD